MFTDLLCDWGAPKKRASKKIDKKGLNVRYCNSFIKYPSSIFEYLSIEMLNNSLVHSLRQNYHNYREGQILKAYQDIGSIFIAQNVVCASCKKHNNGAEFTRQPNNDILHVHCDFDKLRRDNSLEIIDSPTPLHLYLIFKNQSDSIECSLN
ncbi:hypothetical protein Glove_13g119 [Diversispora epigaea]|uniref:Uncharacterized protein n=1 Tax=Diversispora epigaea TaxID=1348612 RepID=A0A397JXH2_9GLOM|nr:hypothetical protein Glove_13g119 [Diversispora epigaea]